MYFECKDLNGEKFVIQAKDVFDAQSIAKYYNTDLLGII